MHSFIFATRMTEVRVPCGYPAYGTSRDRGPGPNQRLGTGRDRGLGPNQRLGTGDRVPSRRLGPTWTSGPGLLQNNGTEGRASVTVLEPRSSVRHRVWLCSAHTLQLRTLQAGRLKFSHKSLVFAVLSNFTHLTAPTSHELVRV